MKGSGAVGKRIYTTSPCCPPQDEPHKYYTLYGSFFQAACGAKKKERRYAKRRMKEETLLDALVKERMRATLDIVLRSNQLYQSALTEQDKAFEQLESIGLNKEQNTIVDRAISANNAVGAAYGVAAYRLGLQDGIQLASELKEIK